MTLSSAKAAIGSTLYLNGAWVAPEQALVSIFDRGFLFADSVYEVIPFYSGHGFRLQEHCARLQRSLTAVGIETQQDWAALCNELVQRNGGGDLAVYLQVTRGVQGYRHHRYPEGLTPTVAAFCYAIPAALGGDPALVDGIRAALIEDIRWQRCDIKATSLLANVMVLQQAIAQGAQEALLVRDNYLTEGSACNLMLVEGGVICTPNQSAYILGGTTRDLLIELATGAGMTVCEEPIHRDRLFGADEVWITSSTKGVLPVLQVDDQVIGDGCKGPVWHKMAALFQQFEQQVRIQPSSAG